MWFNLTQNFPATTGIRWFNLAILVITPAIAGYGLLLLPRQRATMFFAALYYVFSMLGEKHVCYCVFHESTSSFSPGITAGMTDLRSGNGRIADAYSRIPSVLVSQSV
jgi:stearoyl-CoA desaturase (delta-9 desaturase)